MIKQIMAGFLAGFSTGVYCIGACLPVFVPLLIRGKQKLKSSFMVVLEFLLGRIVGYLLFGSLVGYLGIQIRQSLIYRVMSLALVVNGLLLVFYSLSLIKWQQKACKIFLNKIKIPILLGFLTGVNVCPPFIASLTYVFGLKDVLKSLLYFFSFFIATSLYLVPAGFLGLFSKDIWLNKLARISGVFVGLYFVWQGIIRLVISV